PVGLQGSFSLWGRLRGVVAGVAWRRLLLLCAGETASGGAPPRHSHATGGSQPVHGQEDGEARRRNFPRPPGRAGTGRRPRHRAPRKPTRGPPPPRLPGATDGNHGESTGTGGGPGSANAREQERRAAASNIPDSVSYFVSPNGPTTGPRRAPAIAQASHNFMERRLPGGIPDFPFRRPRGRPMYDNAVYHSRSRSQPGLAGVGRRLATRRGATIRPEPRHFTSTHRALLSS